MQQATTLALAILLVPFGAAGEIEDYTDTRQYLNAVPDEDCTETEDDPWWEDGTESECEFSCSISQTISIDVESSDNTWPYPDVGGDTECAGVDAQCTGEVSCYYDSADPNGDGDEDDAEHTGTSADTGICSGWSSEMNPSPLTVTCAASDYEGGGGDTERICVPGISICVVIGEAVKETGFQAALVPLLGEAAAQAATKDAAQALEAHGGTGQFVRLVATPVGAVGLVCDGLDCALQTPATAPYGASGLQVRL